MKRLIFFPIFTILLGLISFQCIPKFDEPVAPNWDTQLAVPILDKSYSFADLISKDSSKIAVDSTHKIFYRTSSASKPSTVGDAITVTPKSTSPITLQVGEFAIQTPGTTQQTIKLIDSIPGLGSFSLPSKLIDTSMQVGGTISEFEFVKFSSGTMSLFIKNNLPVPIRPDSILIKNFGTSEYISQFYNLGTLAPGDSITQSFNLANSDTMRNQLELRASIFADSGTVSLPLSPKFISISFKIQNAKATSARAKIPHQPVGNVVGTVPFLTDYTIAQPTLINYARFKQGKMYFIVHNNIDLNLGLILKLNEFRKRSNGDTLKIDTTIGRVNSSSGGNFSFEINMREYEINFIGNPTNSFTYVAAISNLDSANSFRTIHSSDFIQTNISIPQDSAFILESVDGRVSPFQTSISETLNVNLGDVDSHFHGHITFNGSKVNLGLFIGGGVKTKLNMVIYGQNHQSGISDSITIPTGEDTIHPNMLNTINLSLDQFFETFSYPNLPDKIILKGSAFFNPDYQDGFVADTTSVFGTFNFTFPLQMKIDNAQFLDTSNVNTGIDKSKLDNINFGTVAFSFSNAMPIRVSLDVDLVDSMYYNGDIIHGTKYSQHLVIDSGKTSQNLPTVSSSTITVGNSDADAIAKGSFVIYRLGIMTSGNEVVTFRSTDKINIKAIAKLGYHVDPNDQHNKQPVVSSSKRRNE